MTNLTVQDVEEIFQLRELFEITALKSAINCITDDELDYIEDRVRYLDDKKKRRTPPRREAFYRSDRDLHMMIMKYSGNSRMIKFHKTLEAQLEQLRRISAMTPKRLVKIPGRSTWISSMPCARVIWSAPPGISPSTSRTSRRAR